MRRRRRRRTMRSRARRITKATPMLMPVLALVERPLLLGLLSEPGGNVKVCLGKSDGGTY